MSTYAYKLRVTALVEVLKSLHASMTLCAPIPPQPPFSQKSGFAELSFWDGQLQNCRLLTAVQHHLPVASREVFSLLKDLGMLEWRIAPVHERNERGNGQEPAAFGLTRPPDANRRRPPCKRVTTLPASEGWTHRHRQIFLLVDGHKDSARLAALLALPLERVERLLSELEQRRLISFEDYH